MVRPSQQHVVGACYLSCGAFLPIMWGMLPIMWGFCFMNMYGGVRYLRKIVLSHFAADFERTEADHYHFPGHQFEDGNRQVDPRKWGSETALIGGYL